MVPARPKMATYLEEGVCSILATCVLMIFADGRIEDVSTMDFSNQNRLDLVEMMAVSEEHLGSKRIDDWFGDDFFKTNFWYMWDTMFAFQPWHSAVEFKRYLHRFIHEFERINTLAGVDRTPYNQYDSLVKPLIKWLREQGVHFEMGAEVTCVDFTNFRGVEMVKCIHYIQHENEKEVHFGPDDLLLVTIGSMTADSSLGSMRSAPKLITDKADGSWKI